MKALQSNCWMAGRISRIQSSSETTFLFSTIQSVASPNLKASNSSITSDQHQIAPNCFVRPAGTGCSRARPSHCGRPDVAQHGAPNVSSGRAARASRTLRGRPKDL
jgi:hypothetical protein